MAISSRVELKGYLDSLPSGSVSFNPTPLASADAPGKVDYKVCTTGDNTFTPPAKSIGVIINYPAAAASRILKGAGADTGLKLGITAGFTVLTLNPASLSDVILAVATTADTLPTTLTYF